MKKPLTEAVSMTFTGPIAMMQTAIAAMRELGFQERQSLPAPQAGASIPWRESVYFKDMPFPGSYLAGFRHREGMTQMELAERSGIPRRHISEMENGKRPIGKANAKKLAASLNIDPRLLLAP
ncbi:MAG: helix-turn-helix transcriptional regulator [Deltaproteobacteria bacterium]|nr:helix-turn-helix transcriptional regulator [Deltaproteobacteria bacterium]